MEYSADYLYSLYPNAKSNALKSHHFDFHKIRKEFITEIFFVLFETFCDSKVEIVLTENVKLSKHARIKEI